MPALQNRFFANPWWIVAVGQIYGVLFTVYALGIGIGPMVMGTVFERTQSYTLALVGIDMCLVVAALLVLCPGIYRYPAPRKDSAH